jgi:hypothetical protein
VSAAATNPFLARAPVGLVEALERRQGAISYSWRENLRAFAHAPSPDGELFARYSEDPDDVARLEQEATIRKLVGDQGALRAPPVLERGEGWMIERAVGWQPIIGSAAIDAAAAAAAEIPQLELPKLPFSRGGRSRVFGLWRVARAAIGPISLRDLRAARRELAETDLPKVTCHRDFTANNILIEDGAAWVIDWERARFGPAGLDLMQLWTTLAEPEDRERLFEHGVDLVGAQRRASLERLRFAVAVAEASGMLAARDAFDRDDAALARLLEMIPSLRPG